MTSVSGTQNRYCGQCEREFHSEDALYDLCPTCRRIVAPSRQKSREEQIEAMNTDAAGPHNAHDRGLSFHGFLSTMLYLCAALSILGAVAGLILPVLDHGILYFGIGLVFAAGCYVAAEICGL